MNLLTPEKGSNKQLFWIGLLSYSVLFILALFFYKERTIFLDSAFRFYHILKEGDYTIQVNRFGSYFTQSFIYVGYLLGLPLKFIMMAYSESFIIANIIVYFAALKWLNSPKLALTLLLSNVFMVASTFYWIQSELIEGITFTFLYFATVQHFAEKKVHLLRLILLLCMLITVVFFHPMLIIVYLFISLFSALNPKNKLHLKYLLGALPFAVGILVVKSIYFKTIYDSNATELLWNIQKYFPNYHKLDSNGIFLEFVLHDYYLLPFLLVGVLAFYIRNKAWLKLGLVFSFCLGHYLIVSTSFPVYDRQFHLESFYLPISIFLLLPFVSDILPKITAKYALILLSSIIIIRLFHIGFKHEKFTAGLNWKRAVLEETANFENRKLIIDEKYVPLDLLELSWGSSFEFWMLSAVEFEEQRSIIIYKNRDDVSKWGKLKKKDGFQTEWGCTNYNDLPPPYFNMTDTGTVYVDYIPKNWSGGE